MSSTSCHFDGNTINITIWKEVLGNAKSKAFLSEKRKNVTNVFVLPLLPIIIGNDVLKWRRRSKKCQLFLLKKKKKKERKRKKIEKHTCIFLEQKLVMKVNFHLLWTIVLMVKRAFFVCLKEHWLFPKTLRTLIFQKAFGDQASDITATKSSRPQTYSPSTDLSRSCARSSYDMARVKAGGLSASEARSPFEAVAIRPWQPLK